MCEIKELIEKREALRIDLNKQMQDVQAQFRNFTDKESEKFDATEEEIRKLDETIKIKKAFESRNTLAITDNEIRDYNKYLNSLENYLKVEDSKSKKAEELRALTSANANALVQTTIYKEIVKLAKTVAPIFSMIDFMTPVAGKVDIVREENIGTAGFITEGNNILFSDITFSTVRLEQKRCGAYMLITDQLRFDTDVNVVNYAKGFLYRSLLMTLNEKVVTGTVAKGEFEGLVNVNNYITENTFNLDALLKAYFFLPKDYRKNAIWVMNQTVFNNLLMQKDNLGHYFFIENVAGEVKYKLLGREVHIIESTPDKRIYFTNINETLAGMIKKNPTLKVIDKDTTNALRGTTTLVLDIYTDVKIKNKHATVELRER